MINELAGHLGWSRINRNSMDVYYYLQAGNAVYRCSQSENVWRQVSTPLSSTSLIFSAPLKKMISRCLTDSDGCKYVLFDDKMGIRVFDPPNPPGVITIHDGGVKLLYPDDCDRLFAVNDNLSETPITRA
jgi:hypothetical protein